MNRSRQRWWVAIAALGIAASGCRKTTLELTAHGGFAYVRNDDGTVDIGFMKSVDNARCKVPQFGVDLRIDDGTIVSPKDAPTMIDVSNATITFDNIGRSAVTLTGNGLSSTPRPNASTNMPPQPPYRTTEEGWKDIYWVPHTRLSYLSQRLDPNWRKTKVDGLVSLAGGSISGGSPSDGASVNGVWAFKRKSDPPSTKPMTQAITDRTRYRTEIRGTQIVMKVKFPSETRTYTIEPLDGRRTVGIILTGRHDPMGITPVKINVGDPITDFCTFYELFERPPAKDDQLIPHYAGLPPNTPVPTTGHPTPGAYCPGDWP